ncbi:hypothetical protein E2C01_025930 [Portunus trituberculatus]|uniref:Uncharacterized protein n=1 Tax=Portunus trituberculatus TaxID=210409 RepID=A0A5B7EEI0_PORTR|nr:hypothetical protein [Portunus trituberculatus]
MSDSKTTAKVSPKFLEEDDQEAVSRKARPPAEPSHTGDQVRKASEGENQQGQTSFRRILVGGMK